jgi:hypothetical protein
MTKNENAPASGQLATDYISSPSDASASADLSQSDPTLDNTGGDHAS